MFLLYQHFQQDITGVSVKEVFAGGNGRLLNRSLCEHLLREGRMDVAETLINVSSNGEHEM